MLVAVGQRLVCRIIQRLVASIKRCLVVRNHPSIFCKSPSAKPSNINIPFQEHGLGRALRNTFSMAYPTAVVRHCPRGLVLSPSQPGGFVIFRDLISDAVGTAIFRVVGSSRFCSRHC
jgi:hypothetical protein